MSDALKRTGTIVGAFLLAAAVLVVAMFAFGKPVTPQTLSQTAPAGAAASQAGDTTSATADASDPLAVQIPGCVCHSDEPAVVEAHAAYRMSQCFDCHRDGMPDMEQ